MTVYETAVEELSSRNIYPFVPMGVNFAINLVWLVVRKLFLASQDYRTAQEAQEQGGTGIFLTVEVILYLFSFMATLAVFLTLDFLFKIKEMGKIQYMWWLPSAISIGLAEIAKVLEGLVKKKPETVAAPPGSIQVPQEVEAEETQLEKRTQQFTFYFWITVLVLGATWGYILFGDDPDLFLDLFSVANTLFL